MIGADEGPSRTFSSGKETGSDLKLWIYKKLANGTVMSAFNKAFCGEIDIELRFHIPGILLGPGVFSIFSWSLQGL